MCQLNHPQRALILASALLAILISVDAASAQVPSPNATKICPPAAPGSHEKYRLPSPRNVPESISFGTDWKESASGGWFGQQTMDACRIRLDGFATWHGKQAVRIEVQPGDDPLNLKSNSERAESLGMQDPGGRQIKESGTSGKQFYATSYYLPPMWQGQQLPWSAFAPIDCSAGNLCASWSFIWQFYGWESLSAARTTVNGEEHYRFNGRPFTRNGLIASGKWTDFVFFVDWSDGSYTIWRRDEGQTGFDEVLKGRAAVAAGREIYVKQGLYRGGNVGGRTDVLWIGPTARGSSFSAVERYAFGTDEGAK